MKGADFHRNNFPKAILEGTENFIYFQDLAETLGRAGAEMIFYFTIIS